MMSTSQATMLFSIGLALLLSTGCSQPSSDTASDESQESGTPTGSASHLDSGEQPKDSAVVSATDLQEETQEVLDLAQQYTARKMDDYRTAMEERLVEVQERIGALKMSAGETTEELKPEIRGMLDTMQKKLEKTRDMLREKHGETAEAKDTLIEGIDSAVSELEKAADEVRKQLVGGTSDPTNSKVESSTDAESAEGSGP